MDDRLTLALTLGLPILMSIAALLATVRATRATVPILLLGALACAIAGVAILPGVRRAISTQEVVFATWSPLGLYGVELAVRTHALGSFLAVPCTLAALAGWLRSYGPPWRDLTGARVSIGQALVDASLLAALSGALWALVAGDLVSIVLGIGAYGVATAAALHSAGATDAGRTRLLVTGALALCLVACVLLLGKVNGSFVVSHLASVSFSDASLAGIVIVAYGIGNAAPFHAWSLRLARQPLMPAVAATASALSLSLVTVAFVTTGGDLAVAWQGALIIIGLVAVALAIGRSWDLGHPRLRLATLLGGRSGLAMLALSSGAPGTISALTLLHGVASAGTALLWVIAPGASGLRPVGDQTPGARAPVTGTGSFDRAFDGQGRSFVPAGGTGIPSGAARLGRVSVGSTAPAGLESEATRLRSGRLGDVRPDAWRGAGPWLVIMVVATAAGLPGTVGGLAADSYLTALTASSDAGSWLRLAALFLDTAIIGAGGAVLAAGLGDDRSRRIAQARRSGRDLGAGPSRGVWDASPSGGRAWRSRPGFLDVVRDAVPWIGVAVGLVAVVAPSISPSTLVGPWFAPVSVVVAGTTSPPRLVDALRIASPDRIVLALAAGIALWRTQRGEETLPPTARATLGVAVLALNPVFMAISTSVRLGRAVLLQVRSVASRWAGKASTTVRQVEERYYAAIAVIVLVVLLYGLGR